MIHSNGRSSRMLHSLKIRGKKNFSFMCCVCECAHIVDVVRQTTFINSFITFCRGEQYTHTLLMNSTWDDFLYINFVATIMFILLLLLQEKKFHANSLKYDKSHKKIFHWIFHSAALECRFSFRCFRSFSVLFLSPPVFYRFLLRILLSLFHVPSVVFIGMQQHE